MATVLQKGIVIQFCFAQQGFKHLELINASKCSSDADYAIAITGYAGPTGGTETDPVGTVYISVGTAEQGITKRVVSQFSERTAIQDDVAQQAIDLFNKFLDVEL